MKVGHCIHGVGLGGAQQVIKFIVSARDRNAFEHTVFAAQSGVFHAEIVAAGATVRVVPRHLRKFDPLWVQALAGAFRRDHIDVVHTHLFGDSLHGFLAARRAGPLPVIMTLHNTAESRNPWQRLGYDYLIRRVERTVACAEFVRRSFLARPRVHGAQIRTITNALALAESFPPAAQSRQALCASLGVRADAVVLATIGRMVPQKGYPLLLKACAALRQRDGVPPFQLIFLGQGEQQAELAAQVRREGLADTVIFAGFRADVKALLPGIDVVVFSSFQEGLPIALLEAMAAGCCVVATDVGGVPEAVSADREALLVPSGDPQQLADALAQAITQPELRSRLGRAAQERFARDFAVERMVRDYEALYREVTREVPPGRALGEET